MGRPSLENMLMKQLGLTYGGARKLVLEGRDSLGINKFTEWTDELAEECKRIHAAKENGDVPPVAAATPAPPVSPKKEEMNDAGTVLRSFPSRSSPKRTIKIKAVQTEPIKSISPPWMTQKKKEPQAPSMSKPAVVVAPVEKKLEPETTNNTTSEQDKPTDSPTATIASNDDRDTKEKNQENVVSPEDAVVPSATKGDETSKEEPAAQDGPIVGEAAAIATPDSAEKEASNEVVLDKENSTTDQDKTTENNDNHPSDVATTSPEEVDIENNNEAKKDEPESETNEEPNKDDSDSNQAGGSTEKAQEEATTLEESAVISVDTGDDKVVVADEEEAEMVDEEEEIIEEEMTEEEYVEEEYEEVTEKEEEEIEEEEIVEEIEGMVNELEEIVEEEEEEDEGTAVEETVVAEPTADEKPKEPSETKDNEDTSSTEDPAKAESEALTVEVNEGATSDGQQSQDSADAPSQEIGINNGIAIKEEDAPADATEGEETAPEKPEKDAVPGNTPNTSDSTQETCPPEKSVKEEPQLPMMIDDDKDPAGTETTSVASPTSETKQQENEGTKEKGVEFTSVAEDVEPENKIVENCIPDLQDEQPSATEDANVSPHLSPSDEKLPPSSSIEEERQDETALIDSEPLNVKGEDTLNDANKDNETADRVAREAVEDPPAAKKMQIDNVELSGTKTTAPVSAVTNATISKVENLQQLEPEPEPETITEIVEKIVVVDGKRVRRKVRQTRRRHVPVSESPSSAAPNTTTSPAPNAALLVAPASENTSIPSVVAFTSTHEKSLEKPHLDHHNQTPEVDSKEKVPETTTEIVEVVVNVDGKRVRRKIKKVRRKRTPVENQPQMAKAL